ncbi:hypothetical protein B0H34DRAFT_798930 [Crassisporium funariophilum]|nr:hypothetical protein B0H34DRAFT_798930 [Crassisporium funariophilum]
MSDDLKNKDSPSLGSGTNSPPLEATGSSGFMGVSGIGGERHGHVSDAEQRKDYFKGSDTNVAEKEKNKQDNAGARSGEKQSSKVGKCLEDQFEKST